MRMKGTDAEQFLKNKIKNVTIFYFTYARMWKKEKMQRGNSEIHKEAQCFKRYCSKISGVYVTPSEASYHLQRPLESATSHPPCRNVIGIKLTQVP